MNEPRTSGAVSSDEFRRLRDIFESALERPPADRSRYVEGACAGDATLIGEVERMLRADAEHHPILDASVLLWSLRLRVVRGLVIERNYLTTNRGFEAPLFV